MNENFFLKKNALVVGGTGGIGKEISFLLAKCGANVVAQGRCVRKKKIPLNIERIALDFTKIDLNEFLKKSNSKKMDEKSAEQKFCCAIQNCDILCLCFGPFLQKPLEKTFANDWLKMTSLNLALPGILASRAAFFMKQRGFGRILFFGGTRTCSINGFRTCAAYAAAKTGIASLAKSFALQFAPFGIATNAIFPGFVQTEYVGENQKLHYEKLLGGKMVLAKSIAQKALFLLSENDLNGVLLAADMGWMP